MSFENILRNAQQGNKSSVDDLFKMYKPYLVANSIVDGTFDEDLYQELTELMIKTIKIFEI